VTGAIRSRTFRLHGSLGLLPKFPKLSMISLDCMVMRKVIDTTNQCLKSWPIIISQCPSNCTLRQTFVRSKRKCYNAHWSLDDFGSKQPLTSYMKFSDHHITLVACQKKQECFQFSSILALFSKQCRFSPDASISSCSNTGPIRHDHLGQNVWN
jgi:hypothetical protein